MLRSRGPADDLESQLSDNNPGPPSHGQHKSGHSGQPHCALPSVLSVCKATQVEEVLYLVLFTDGEHSRTVAQHYGAREPPYRLAPRPVVLRHLSESFELEVGLGLNWAPSSTYKGIGV